MKLLSIALQTLLELILEFLKFVASIRKKEGGATSGTTTSSGSTAALNEGDPSRNQERTATDATPTQSASRTSEGSTTKESPATLARQRKRLRLPS